MISEEKPGKASTSSPMTARNPSAPCARCGKNIGIVIYVENGGDFAVPLERGDGRCIPKRSSWIPASSSRNLKEAIRRAHSRRRSPHSDDARKPAGLPGVGHAPWRPFRAAIGQAASWPGRHAVGPAA